MEVIIGRVLADESHQPEERDYCRAFGDWTIGVTLGVTLCVTFDVTYEQAGENNQ